jgi:hypothetical protein
MDESCRVLADATLSDAFDEGGSVLIRAANDIEFRPGGHPGGEALATASTQCVGAIDGLGVPNP